MKPKHTSKTALHWIKRSFVLALAAALASSFAASGAASEASSGGKEEVVYAMLQADGAVSGMYVVNSFDRSGSIVDYGDYSAVRNMTTNDKITQNGNQVTITNTGKKLYYEGTLKKLELPWNISIQYAMDGKAYSPEEIAGKSGALTIHMQITQDPDVNETFYKNYALQAAFTLDSNKCKNIRADDATVANVGGDKQLTYTILPGKGADVTITADVTDFTMKAVAINGIRLNLNIQVDDTALMQKVDEIKDAANQLDSGAGDLKNGASDLKGGTDQLVSGANDLKNGSADLDGGVASLQSGVGQVQAGLNELNGKSSALVTGSAQVKDALTQIQAALSGVSADSAQINALVNASAGIKAGINDLYSNIGLLQSNVGYAQYRAVMAANGLDIDALKAGNTDALNTLTAQIATLTAQYDAIKDSADPAVQAQAAQLKAQIDQLTGIVTLLTGDNAAIGGTETYLNTVFGSIAQLEAGAKTLNDSYAAFDQGIGKLGQTLGGLLVKMTDLSNAINTLAEKYSALDSGINDYTNGVAQIVAGYSGVVDGVGQLAAGSKSVSDGSSTLYAGTADLMDGVDRLYGGTVDLKNGTGEFKDKTADMDTQVSSQINDTLSTLTGDGSQPVSFVSSQNTDVQSVQFVIKTADIAVKKQASAPAKKTAALSLWDKLLNLFGLYKNKASQ